MTSLEQKLKELNLTLPEVTTPGGNYVSVNIRQKVAYVAIQFPIVNKAYFYQGKLGVDLSTDEGYKAMELCALNVIAQIEKKIGFQNVLGLNHFDGYYQAGNDFNEAPRVLDGASDIFVNVLMEKGIHSRGIFGVERLSKNFCVGLTSSFTLL